MVGFCPHHQRLIGDGGAQPNDLGALFALVGPTDLTLFSSAVDRDLVVLERRVAQDRVNLFWVSDRLVNVHGEGINKFHVYAFFGKEAMVLSHEPWQTENRAAGLAYNLFRTHKSYRSDLIIVVYYLQRVYHTQCFWSKKAQVYAPSFVPGKDPNSLTPIEA